MSGTAAPSGPLGDAERVQVRKYCGYPAFGAGASGMQSWRFFQSYGMLEYRMTNLTDAEIAEVRGKLADLATMEADIAAAGDNLDTDQAAVWRHNRREVADRFDLFGRWRRALCGFLGLPPGPVLESDAGWRTQ